MSSSNKEQAAQDYMNRHEDVLTLAAGELSEDLISFVAAELDDEMLDGVDIYRVMERRDDLASEPITIAIVCGLGATAIVAVGRIIERWLENKRQRETIELTIHAYKISAEAAQIIAGIALKHAEVSVSYSLNSLPLTSERTDLGECAQ